MTTTSKIITSLVILGIGGGTAYYFWNKNKAATVATPVTPANIAKSTEKSLNEATKTGTSHQPTSADTTEGYYKAAENQQVVAAIKNDLVSNTIITPIKPVNLSTQPLNSPKVGIIIPVTKPIITVPKPAATVPNDDGCQWTSTCW